MLSINSPCSGISPFTLSDTLGLPNEIFLHVLSYLDTRAKLSATQVCKTWSNVFNDWKMWKGATAPLSIGTDMKEIVPILKKRRINRVHISPKQSQELKVVEEGVHEDFTELCNLTRMMSNSLFSLDLTDLYVPHNKLRQALTPTMSNLTELILSNRPLYNTTTWQMLAARCGKLEKLVCCGNLMRNCDITIMGIKMQNLRELDLSLGSSATLSWFNNSSAPVVQSHMPKLTKLNLSTCRITRMPDWFHSHNLNFCKS